jgi:hypothetical protein
MYHMSPLGFRATTFWLTIFTASLSAQSVSPSPEPPIPPAAAGRLIAVHPDSIEIKLNQKVTTIQLTPQTEIWRRGADLTSPAQLMLGENIVARYAKTAADGSPIATIVTASQEGDVVWVEPNHIVEKRVCGGRLIAVAGTSISVQSDDKKVCVLQITPETEIWHGQTFHDTTALRLGDTIDARASVIYPQEDLVADEVWDNITITEGVIVAVHHDRIVVNQYPGADRQSAYPRGHVTVMLDNQTEFVDCSRKDLKAGWEVRAIGVIISPKKFLASTVAHE